MALKVNLKFGGEHTANWQNVGTIIALYKQIADENSLDKPVNGFILLFDAQTGELTGAAFYYAKNGLNESALQTFNDQWQALAQQYNIVRYETNVNYYEE